MNMEKVWEAGIDGRGVKVAIVDDGVQIAHPDLRGNMDLHLSYDFNDHNGQDPTPLDIHGHGTSAAGVCCAIKDNGQCGAGVAPKATLVGLRAIADATTDLTESVVLSYMRNDIDIYSCSWGPEDDARNLSGPGRLTELAFKESAQKGRNGRGSIYVWVSLTICCC